MKYSTLRFLCVVGWGAVALVMSVLGMWALTEMPIWNVIFCGMMIYLAVMTVIACVTEPKKKARAQVTVRKPRQFAMYDMRRRVWNVRK